MSGGVEPCKGKRGGTQTASADKEGITLTLLSDYEYTAAKI